MMIAEQAKELQDQNTTQVSSPIYLANPNIHLVSEEKLKELHQLLLWDQLLTKLALEVISVFIKQIQAFKQMHLDLVSLKIPKWNPLFPAFKRIWHMMLDRKKILRSEN